MFSLPSSSGYLSSANPPLMRSWLPVGQGHEIYVETHGNPAGQAVLVIHGGPGSGNSPAHLRFFADARYFVVLADQRAAGRSRPAGELRENTTAHLLADMELLRQKLGVERWLVVGGSWGGSLAILYAAAQLERVAGLLLRNPFLARQADLAEFFITPRVQYPALAHRWETLGAPEALPAFLNWLDESIHSADAGRVAALAKLWHDWESELSGAGSPSPDLLDEATLRRLIVRYRIQSHYFRHAFFLPEHALLAACDRLAAADFPVHVIQGLADRVCPPAGSRLLLSRMANASADCLPEGTHDPFSEAMFAAMRRACDCFAERGRFG